MYQNRDLLPELKQFYNVTRAKITIPEQNRLLAIAKDFRNINGITRTIEKTRDVPDFRGRYSETTRTTLTITAVDGRIAIREDIESWNDDVRHLPDCIVHDTAKGVLENIDRVAPGLMCPPPCLSATQIGMLVKADGSTVNNWLRERGYLINRGGTWCPTAAGERHSIEVEYPAYTIRYWDLTVVESLIDIKRALQEINNDRWRDGRKEFRDLFDYFCSFYHVRLLDGLTIFDR